MKPSDFAGPRVLQVAGPALLVDQAWGDHQEVSLRSGWYVRDYRDVEFVESNIGTLFVKEHSYLSVARHRRTHRLVAPAFRRGLPGIVQVVDEHLAERIGEVARRGDNTFDLTEAASSLTFRAACSFLGLDGEGESARWLAASKAVDHGGARPVPDTLGADVFKIVSRRVDIPGTDVLGMLVTAWGHKQIALDELQDYVWMVIAAHWENAATIVNTVALLDEFDLLDEVRGRADDQEWVERHIEEVVRFMPSCIQGTAFTLRDVTMPSGAWIPSSSVVVTCYAAANRDPAVFDEPTAFVPSRSPKPRPSFGHGLRSGVGAPLARTVVVAGVTAMLRLLPSLRLHPDRKLFVRQEGIVEATAILDWRKWPGRFPSARTGAQCCSTYDA